MKRSARKKSESFFSQKRTLVLLALLGAFLPVFIAMEVRQQTLTQYAAPVTHEVTIQNFTMNPPALTINAGDTVTWTNQDVEEHDAHSTTEAFASPLLAQGQSFSFTFTQPGTYEYFCTPHKSIMKGFTITVVAATPSATIAPTLPEPTFGCLTVGGCTPTATIAPTQVIMHPTAAPTITRPVTILPTDTPVPSVSVTVEPTQPQQGGGEPGQQNLLALLLALIKAFIELILGLFN